MNKLIKLMLVSCLLGLTFTIKSQVTGVKSIPADFANIQAAVAALNLNGVGAGGATINIPAGYTEALTNPIVLTMTANASGATNPLVFRKNGVGANPLVTAHTTGTSTTVDGIFILNGSDFVTIDGIDLQENAVNITPATQMEWGYALTKQTATNGASNNTIKNCSITLSNANTASTGIYIGNHLFNVNTALTVTNFGGTSSKNKFQNNSIQNCYIGYSITGFASAAPYDLYDQDNIIGVDGVSTRRSQVINFGGGALAANGVFATNQNGFKVFATFFNNISGPASTGAVNGINLATGLNSNVDVYNDTLNLASASTAGSQLHGITNTMGGTGAGNTVNIYNNVISNCTYTTNTSGIFRGINHGASSTNSNIYNNKVTNNTVPGTGELSGIYFSGSNSTLVLDVKIYNNSVNDNIKTGISGAFYGIYASGSTYSTKTYSNQVYNNSASASSSGFYGYYNFAFGFNESVYSNQFYNNTGGSGETVMIYARTGSGPTNKDVYLNTIYNNTANTANVFGAIWLDYATIGSVYRNNIYNLTNNNATGAVPAVFGIQIGANVNAQVSTHNNFISDLKAPNASNVNAIYGIWLLGASNGALSAYYNTVYLNATSSGANFGTAALVCSASPITIDLRNNILTNVSTAAGTGLTRALVRGSASLINYNINSGYNCLFAGTPSASNLIFTDGITNIQTLQAFKNLVGPREQASFSSLPPFVNVAAAPFDLHLQAGTPTQCEGGGTPVAGITVDYDNATRNLTTPDVGADELAGTTIDIASPNIQYTLLPNSSVAPTRNLTNFATITDPSGVNTTIGTRPRLYFKKSTNLNTFNGNTNATDGWKFVEASNAASPFNFSINYSLLFGGAGVVATDIIQYFVTAQDLSSAVNVGLNNGGFAVQPANVNLGAANFPLTNTINQYTILATSYSGTINVGPSEVITSLTNAGGMFALINAGVLSGNVTLNITGDLTAETGLNALNQWAEEGAGNYSVSIVPSAAVTRTISGSNAANSLVRFDGADRVNIDGRFGGSGTFLNFRNTSNAAPSISFINDAQNNTVQYSIIESGNTSVSATLGGALLIGSTIGIDGNDNITISNCEIRDRSDVVASPAIGINCQGNSGAITQYNNNVVISNNRIHDWFLVNSSSQFGINVGIGNSNFTITGNSFYHVTAKTNLISGAVTRAINYSFSAPVNSNGGNVITNNFIGGTAPLCAGGDMTLTVSGVGVSQTFIGMSIITGLIPNSIQNNVIRNIDFTTNAPTAAASVWLGINAGNGIHAIGTQTGNIIGNATGTGALKVTVNAGGAVSSFLAGIQSSAVNGYADIRNNVIGGITIAGSTTAGGIIPQWIQSQGTPQNTTTISNNLIGSFTTPNSISNSAIAPVISFGIRHLITTGAPLAMSNNTVMNITDNSTVATSSSFGMLVVSTVGGAAQLTISNNLVRNISLNAIPASPAFANTGIAIQNHGGILQTIESNTITGLVSANTGTGSAYVVGLQLQSSSLGGVIRKNYINDIRNNNTGSAGVQGIYMNSGLDWNINNNMISVNNGTNTNNVDIAGITEFMGANSTLKLYYNSIYVGGNNATGTTNSFAFNHSGNANLDLRNNLLYNERAGVTATHAAIANSGTSGWFANNNAYVVGDTTKVGIWQGTVSNFNAWKTSSAGDAASIRSINTVVTPAALFVNAANGDLHIATSTFPAGVATPISITTDIDGNTRSATFPAAGADEVACATTSLSVLSQTNINCFGGNTGAATFSASGGNTFIYSWAPITNTLSSATNLTAGIYTVTAINNCSIAASRTISIIQPTALSINATATSTNLCTGNSSTLNVNGTGGTGAITYTWLPGSLTSTAIAVSPTVSTVYTVTALDANGCSSNTVTTSITVNTTPTITVNSGAICSGTSFTIVPSGASTYTYSGGSAVVSPTLTSTYTVTGTSAQGCVNANTAVSNVTVNATPSITVPSATICAGATATLAASGANTYTWSTGANTSFITASPAINTTYTVNGTSAAGCLGSVVSATITVGSAPSIVVNSTSVCAGSSATLSAGGVTTYTWNTGANTSSIVVTPIINTTYTVSGNLVGCGVGATNTASVVVNALPTVTAVSSTTVICTGQTVTLTASGASTYSWTNVGGTAIVVPSPTTTTTYSVIGTSANGCDGNATITVSVSLCTGLAETTTAKSVNIYPNPSTGVYYITAGSDLTGVSVQVYNALGQVVVSKNLEGMNAEINLNTYANGIYLIKFMANKQVVNTARLIKE